MAFLFPRVAGGLHLEVGLLMVDNDTPTSLTVPLSWLDGVKVFYLHQGKDSNQRSSNLVVFLGRSVILFKNVHPEMNTSDELQTFLTKWDFILVSGRILV